MIRRALYGLLAAALVAVNGGSTLVVTAQILDYEKGYVFFTTGDGFRVAPSVAILKLPDDAPARALPATRDYARVTFDPSGVVTKIELSAKPLPPSEDLAAVRRFAVALSTPAPNPDLAATPASACRVQPGRRVTVVFSIQVPPSTKVTDSVYMTTDQSGWSPEAYKLDRVDALHYRTVVRFNSGTLLRYLFDRGSVQSIQRGQDGIEMAPYTLCVGDANAQAVGKIVYQWGDETPTGTLPVPQTLPTPYNPAPFPNLPSPPANPVPGGTPAR